MDPSYNREHSNSVDQFQHEDSMSNQSDSSSSSSARPLGVQSVQYETLLSRDDQDQTNRKSTELPPTKRGLITKNAGHCRRTGEKRRRQLSFSTTSTVKREPSGSFNDEVRSCVRLFHNDELSFVQEDTQTLSSRRRTRQNTENSARQCFGPGCVFEARSTSKYCSDKCGSELARKFVIDRYLKSIQTI